MALTYTNSHIGRSATTGIAQMGMRRRLRDACTYAGIGFGGGGGGGGAAAARAAGAAGATSDEAGGASASDPADPADPPSDGNPSEARRSRDRLRRCSGISVTGVLSQPSSP
jgi:hypothetical protein